MFYNVENLFDTIDTPKKRDEEFTPEGSKRWNSWKYRAKLKALGQILLWVGKGIPPSLVGLCEVENRQVLDDLVNSFLLRKQGYQIIHYESPDFRGIDVALLYRGSEFQPLTSIPLRVVLPSPTSHTRDILYVKGLCYGDTLHLFVNHWPSRYGGEAKSRPKRAAAASTLRQACNEILTRSPEARILIMGDFNDSPTNHSVQSILGAAFPTQGGSPFLYNLSRSNDKKVRGTHRFRGEWAMLDQIIVSPSLYHEDQGLRVVPNSFRIVYNEEKMLSRDKRYGGYTPKRTYLGRTFKGGYSDHLPILIQLTK